MTVAHGFSLLLLALVGLLFHLSIFHADFYGLLSGVFCGAGLVALYSALASGPMGLSAAISGVLTAVVPVLYAWLREGHARPLQIVGFAVAAVAVCLVAYTPDEAKDAQTHPRSLGLAAFAGFCFGAMLVGLHLAAAGGLLWDCPRAHWEHDGSCVDGLGGLADARTSRDDSCVCLL